VNHNLKLNDAAAELVQTNLAYIARAIADLHQSFDDTIVHLVSAERFDEMRAPLGSIADARWVIEQIMFRVSTDDSDYGIDTSSHPSQGNRRRVRILACDHPECHPDHCSHVQRALALVVAATEPVITDDEAAALIEPLPCDDDCTCRGVSYNPEYPDAHPCIEPGCEHTVLFDDEPHCYTHSPDSGSSVRGYSYRAAKALSDAHQRAAEQY
jgi:hypothetical protein